MNRKIIVAGAGSGKTTFIINEALKIPKEKKVLITTYTTEAEENLRNKIILNNGFIPSNIDIQSWFSFLIQHGIKPYQNLIFNELETNKIKGLNFVQKKSGIRYTTSRGPIYFSDTEFKCYFDADYRVYSDKISKLTLKINEATNGNVLHRLNNIYEYIYIDELQDMAGYDLEFIKECLKNKVNFIAVGDPRQTTYRTHYSVKNKKYTGNNFLNYFKILPKKYNVQIDDKILSFSHRCNQEICNLSNELYPKIEAMESCQCQECHPQEINHQGIYFISEDDLRDYLKKYNPIQLRWSSRKKINEEYQHLNFGQAKGLTFNRVLIYPTKEMIKWLSDYNTPLKDSVRAKFYVAITRAKYSVTIVVKDKSKMSNSKIKNYKVE